MTSVDAAAPPPMCRLGNAANGEQIGWTQLQNTLPEELSLRAMDMDVTEACNLACIYCFKWQKKAVHMSEAIALAAIDWFLEASGNFRGELKVNFLGGEPLLRFDLIKKVVPYGKLRARQLGKNLHFGCTTNCTLLTDEILDFWRRFGMGFHCSVDGIPEVQNINRPLLNGKPSAPELERNVRKILRYRPEVMGRATITIHSAPFLRKSAQYLRDLGFRSITFKPAINSSWTKSYLTALRKSYEQLLSFYIDELKSGSHLLIDELVSGLKSLHSPHVAGTSCGAGRGLVLVDPRGDIWPCHRFGPHQCSGGFRLGHLGKGFNERLRRCFLNANRHTDLKADCVHCSARLTCVGWCTAECFDTTGTIYDLGTVFCDIMEIVNEQVLALNDYSRVNHPKLLEELLGTPH